jgi:hypothetical protein
MGYRGKVEAQEWARKLRADGWTLADIAAKLDVAKSSVSLWVRDVEFEPQPRRRARWRGANVPQQRKVAEIEAMNAEGLVRLGPLSQQAFLAAGAALYAGEGAKRDGNTLFANTDPRMIEFFLCWLRQFFAIDESRLRVRAYLHEGLDIACAEDYWSRLTGIPTGQFGKPYRAAANPSIRTNKHVFGCAYVGYSCCRTHRAIMGLVTALLSSDSRSGVAQLAERRPVKPMVVGPSPSPGAPEG